MVLFFWTCAWQNNGIFCTMGHEYSNHLIPSKYTKYQTAVIINFTDAAVKNKLTYFLT